MQHKLLKTMLLALLVWAVVPSLEAQVAHVGDILCEGDLVVSPANYNASTQTAKAVVFYVDNTGQHGWAIALQDAGSFAWGSKYTDTPLTNYYGGYDGTNGRRQAIYDIDGYHNTQTIRESYNYAAFNAVDFENGWYLPAIGQLNYLYGNLDEVNVSLESVGGTRFVGGWEYWSSTEGQKEFAWWLCSSGELRCCVSGDYYNLYYAKNASRLVRAAINF